MNHHLWLQVPPVFALEFFSFPFVGAWKSVWSLLPDGRDCEYYQCFRGLSVHLSVCVGGGGGWQEGSKSMHLAHPPCAGCPVQPSNRPRKQYVTVLFILDIFVWLFHCYYIVCVCSIAVTLCVSFQTMSLLRCCACQLRYRLVRNQGWLL